MKRILFLIIVALLLGMGLLFGKGEAQELSVVPRSPAAGSNLITVQWTAPGDDGNEGIASVYDFRFASDSTILISNWDGAIQLEGEPPPDTAGTQQFYTMTLPEGRWYIALKTADEVQNWSPLSNIVVADVDTTPPGAVVDLQTQ